MQAPGEWPNQRQAKSNAMQFCLGDDVDDTSNKDSLSRVN